MPITPIHYAQFVVFNKKFNPFGYDGNLSGRWKNLVHYRLGFKRIYIARFKLQPVHVLRVEIIRNFELYQIKLNLRLFFATKPGRYRKETFSKILSEHVASFLLTLNDTLILREFGANLFPARMSTYLRDAYCSCSRFAAFLHRLCHVYLCVRFCLPLTLLFFR